MDDTHNMDSTPAGPAHTTNSVFDHPDADIVLRSSDSIDFHTFKFILSHSSPVFKGMLSIPHPEEPPTKEHGESESEDWKDGLPVVRLPEESSVLEALLRVCDPGVDVPTFRCTAMLDRTMLSATFAAASKYEIKKASSFVQQLLLDYADKDFLWVFAIAYKYKLKKVAERAAEHYLGIKALDGYLAKAATFSSELDTSSLIRLCSAREQCVRRLDTFDFDAYLSSWRFQCAECGVRSNSGKNSIAPFYRKFVELSRQALEARPCGLAVTDAALLPPCVKAMCQFCPPDSMVELAKYAQRIGATIDTLSWAVLAGYNFWP